MSTTFDKTMFIQLNNQMLVKLHIELMESINNIENKYNLIVICQ